jgi:ethanolamine ammonia-lyase large subunit
MAITNEKIESALEMALTSLAGVAATGTNEERIAASKVLIEAVEMASNQMRKQMITTRVLPLIDSVTRNLSGTLTENDDYAPVYSLEPAQQGSILMSLTKELA